jgi:hypothetical protein
MEPPLIIVSSCGGFAVLWKLCIVYSCIIMFIYFYHCFPGSVFLWKHFLYHMLTCYSYIVISQEMQYSDRLGLDGQCSNPDRDRTFLFSTAARPALGPTQPAFRWVLGAISTGCEGGHSCPSATGVKNGGAIPPLPDMSSWHSA